MVSWPACRRIQGIQLRLLELTLLRFEEELIGFEDLKDLWNDATVFFHSLSGDKMSSM